MINKQQEVIHFVILFRHIRDTDIGDKWCKVI